MPPIPTKLRVRFLVQQQEDLDRLGQIDDVHGAYLRLVAATWLTPRRLAPGGAGRRATRTANDDDTTPSRRLAG